VRRLLHAHGLRYRVDIRPVPTLRRRADIVFPRQKVAVFIDGCFWHGCPEHGTTTFHTNSAFWTRKVLTNVARDQETSALIEGAGWQVLRFWEHVAPEAAAEQIETTIQELSG
jgi:DNA mismatch endonuclease (patch repair protein)